MDVLVTINTETEYREYFINDQKIEFFENDWVELLATLNAFADYKTVKVTTNAND